MEDDKKHVEQTRKVFFEEFVKVKHLIATSGSARLLRDKAGFIASIRRILGL